MKTKKCSHCNQENHTSIMCFSKPRATPKNKKMISRVGKNYRLWNEYRRDWIQKNTDGSGYWNCFYCGVQLDVDTLTLDHIELRSARPDLRYDHSNLIPACAFDNGRRGSIKFEKYIEQYYPHLKKP